ncbi:MAG: superoxide dismutase [Gemmatimonadota bacterium]|jgi:hypothetical protein
MTHSAPRTALALVPFLLLGCSESEPAGVLEPVSADWSLSSFPAVIPLPNGFSPEGIVIGNGTDFYVGSLQDGAIYAGDLRTGAGGIRVSGQAGDLAVGLAFDPRTGYLFVAGGFGAEARVYETSTGALVGAWPAPGAGFLNDVVVTRSAAYLTDSFTPTLYRLPLGTNGEVPAGGALEAVPLGGAFPFIPGDFNANGIEATPDGASLLIVNSAAASLYRVDPATGVAAAVDVGGPLTAADGIELAGGTLYVVQNSLNRIAEVRLAPDLGSGEIVGFITSLDFRIPTTADRFGAALYAVNARFDVAPPGTPNSVEFEVVRVPR